MLPPQAPKMQMQQSMEPAQMGQGSQSFENVEVNSFIGKTHHKTAAKVQLKRPNILNPVQDPKHRDHSLGGSSDGGDNRSLQGSSVGGFASAHGGYLSAGAMQTDNESARMSNV